MIILSVREVGRYVNDLLAIDEVLSDLWVGGEISNLVRSAAGHTYFTLKDDNSQLKCVLFRRTGQTSWLSHLENGTAVVAHGRLAVYEANGALQFYVDVIQPEGIGDLQLEFERLKAQLQKEGLFEPARKRKLPSLPARIGVVTSTAGAAVHDILQVISRRFPLAEVIVSPTSVQGAGAAEEIVRAIELVGLVRAVDVIILARGGGSLEDLWPFNEESVARAIFSSRVPVITGIGHETDFTIADMVADMRAPTPSAAAEIAVPDLYELRDRLDSQERFLVRQLLQELDGNRSKVDLFLKRLSFSGLSTDILRQRLESLKHRSIVAIEKTTELQAEQLRGFTYQLDTLNPQATLERGYAIVQNSESTTVVKKVTDIEPGVRLSIRVGDGIFSGQVVE